MFNIYKKENVMKNVQLFGGLIVLAIFSQVQADQKTISLKDAKREKPGLVAKFEKLQNEVGQSQAKMTLIDEICKIIVSNPNSDSYFEGGDFRCNFDQPKFK